MGSTLFPLVLKTINLVLFVLIAIFLVNAHKNSISNYRTSCVSSECFEIFVEAIPGSNCSTVKY